MGKKGSKFVDPNVMGPHLFKPGRVVGKGAFGKVLAVIKKDTKILYAMKLLNKKQLIDKKMVKSVINERVLLSQLDFPFLVNLNYAFQTDQELCMVIDLMTGGDLRFHLDKGKFKEPRVVFYAACLVLTLEHLREKRILHRDLKPDNFLLDADGFCHLTDFNISLVIEPGKEPKNFAGTAPYTAPEVYRRDQYDFSADWWSLGITIYEMLTGRLPFEGKKEDLERLILTTEPHYPNQLSPEAQDILQKLLVKNPAERLQGPEIKNHKFFQGIEWDKLLKKEIKPPFEPDRTRANVDGTFDLDEQFQLKPEKFTLSLEEHLQFQEWDWCKDKMPTRSIQEILEEEKPVEKKKKKIANSSSVGNMAAAAEGHPADSPSHAKPKDT